MKFRFGIIAMALALLFALCGCAVGFNKKGEFYCTEGPVETAPSCF